MVWHGSTYIVPQDRSFQGTLYFFGQVDSVPRGLAVMITRDFGSNPKVNKINETLDVLKGSVSKLKLWSFQNESKVIARKKKMLI